MFAVFSNTMLNGMAIKNYRRLFNCLMFYH